MRHEQIAKRESFVPVDVAAVWPAAAQIAPVPIPDLEPPAPAFEATPSSAEIPAGVGILVAGAYAALLGTLFLATAGSLHSVFMIVVAAVFLVMFFAVPAIFLRIEPTARRRVSFEGFLQKGIPTLTGHSSAPAALVQMLIVPVLLTFAIAAMGIAAAIIM